MRKIGFLLIDGYALMSTAAAMEPLRAANLFAKQPLYEIDILSIEGENSASSLGAEFDTVALAQAAQDFDIVFVVAGGDPFQNIHPKLGPWLRHMDRSGVALGGISGGAAILAQADLLAHRRFTIHWHHMDALKSRFPNLPVERRLFVIDRDRYTCAGGTAPLDMMYAIIAAEHGSRFARRISDWFIQTEIRAAHAPQQAQANAPHGGQLPLKVGAALELMETHIADPLELHQIATLVGLSERQLQRQFKAALGETVMGAYRSIRLNTANQLLKHSSNRISDIAFMTGFASQAALATAFRQKFEMTPRDARKAGATGATSNKGSQ